MNELVDEGFHCAGTCWDEVGGIDGLFHALTARGVEKRDWFVQAGWTEAPPTDLTLPPQAHVHPIQNYLNLEAVARYETRPPHSTGAWDAYPTLFTWRSHTYVFQGTHRLAALYRHGASTFRGYHIVVEDF